jgi:hypothetical protein
MNSDVHILLPFHVRSGPLMKVMARLAGSDCWRVGREGVEWPMGPGQKGRFVDLPFQGDLPSSADNPWFVQFEHPPYSQPSLSQHHDFEHGRLCFQDGARQHHSWIFFPEYSDSFLESKLACADSIALNAAIAEGVIAFFGGTVLYDHRMPALDCRHDPCRALFPPREPGMSDDERKYQFENALWALSALTGTRLRQAAECSSYGITAPCRNLMASLDAHETRRQLQLALDDVEHAKAVAPTRI